MTADMYNSPPNSDIWHIYGKCLHWAYIFSLLWPIETIDLLPDTKNWGLRMRRECRERFPHHRGLVIPTCITARDACRDR